MTITQTPIKLQRDKARLFHSPKTISTPTLYKLILHHKNFINLTRILSPQIRKNKDLIMRIRPIKANSFSNIKDSYPP